MQASGSSARSAPAVAAGTRGETAGDQREATRQAVGSEAEAKG